MSDEATNDPTSSALTREELLNALRTLSDKLGERGVTGELCLFGGTVMVLAFSARLATKDVDALFKPPETIREVASRIAEELHLPNDWLNDGVKGFLSPRHETTVSDITFLIRHLGIKSAREVLDIVAQYYPSNQIPVKTQYLIEGLFDEGHI
jgi:hypothetical protein